jgi:nucleotide-binding universal stress UspA family protein
VNTPADSTIAFVKILVPTDFTDASKKALDYAKAIGLRYKSEIILTHVSAPMNPMLTPEGEWFEGDSALQRMNEQIEEGSAELRSEGFKCRAVSLTGSVEREILFLAEQEHVDIIVLGTTHRKAGWERFISGSCAEDLYRKSSRPMLIIGPQVNPIAIKYWQPRSIMCAITLNPNESSLGAFAYTLADGYGATFTLVHLVYPSVGEPEGKLLHFQQAMHMLLPNMKVPHYVLKTLSSLDSIGPMIVELAKEHDSDLIVMGANPATFVTTHFRHGISSRVIVEAPCPVLILHH